MMARYLLPLFVILSVLVVNCPDPLSCRAAVIVAGTDTVSFSTSRFSITIDDPFFPGGLSEEIRLTSGPFDIIRQQQQGDGSGGPLDTIDTEIVSLTLMGTNPSLGVITVRIGAGNGVQEGSTLGQITHVRSDPEGTLDLVGPENFISGNSFFDVFFEVDVLGATFYNRDPHIIQALITSLPPSGETHIPLDFVPIFLRVGATNDPTDPQVGIASGTHTPEPIPEPSGLAVWGLLATLGISVGCRRRKAARREHG